MYKIEGATDKCINQNGGAYSSLGLVIHDKKGTQKYGATDPLNSLGHTNGFPTLSCYQKMFFLMFLVQNQTNYNVFTLILT